MRGILIAVVELASVACLVFAAHLIYAPAQYVVAGIAGFAASWRFETASRVVEPEEARGDS